MRPSLSWSASSPRILSQTRRVGVRGTRISTRRSTTFTADRPEAAALACSQARCRQVAEHHFGIGPRLRGVIGPPHHPQARAVSRRSRPATSAWGALDGVAPAGVCSAHWRRRDSCSRRCRSRSRWRARYPGLPLVPIPMTLHMSLQYLVTTNYGTRRCKRCVALDLDDSPVEWMLVKEQWQSPVQGRFDRGRGCGADAADAAVLVVNGELALEALPTSTWRPAQTTACVPKRHEPDVRHLVWELWWRRWHYIVDLPPSMSTTPKGAFVKPGIRMNACCSLAPERASLSRTSLW